MTNKSTIHPTNQRTNSEQNEGVPQHAAQDLQSFLATHGQLQVTDPPLSYDIIYPRSTPGRRDDPLDTDRITYTVAYHMITCTLC